MQRAHADSDDSAGEGRDHDGSEKHAEQLARPRAARPKEGRLTSGRVGRGVGGEP